MHIFKIYVTLFVCNFWGIYLLSVPSMMQWIRYRGWCHQTHIGFRFDTHYVIISSSDRRHRKNLIFDISINIILTNLLCASCHPISGNFLVCINEFVPCTTTHMICAPLLLVVCKLIWGLCRQKQVSQAGISDYIPRFTQGCNYLSLLSAEAGISGRDK